MENADFVDTSKVVKSTKVDSDEESLMETISDFSNETAADKDKEGTEYEKSPRGDKSILKDEELREKYNKDTGTSGMK